MLTIYFRHLFNGLNVTYYTPYIPNIEKLNAIGMILNYSIIFSILFLFRVEKSQIYKGDLLSVSAVIILPVLVALPGAVEVRFFLPLHMLIYSIFAVFIGNLGEAWQTAKKNSDLLLRIFIFYVLFIIGALSFSAMIATTIPDSVILVSN